MHFDKKTKRKRKKGYRFIELRRGRLQKGIKSSIKSVHYIIAAIIVSDIVT